MITVNTRICEFKPESEAVQYAIKALRRDITNACFDSELNGIEIAFEQNESIKEECFEIKKESKLIISASDDLGFIYGLYYISKIILGINEFWFWNEQVIKKKEKYIISDNYYYKSDPFKVRFRGWFINDEVLIDNWKIDDDNDKPWEMAFEALLRCGGNMTIPGTDENAHIYWKLASKMGLRITHHHAEPLGAEMFSRAYPDKEASFDKYPELFEKLWRDAIERQSGHKVLWNLGFRGQGDRPFWSDDPKYDTDEKRGCLMSKLIKKQYDIVKSYDKHAVCCSNLYGETMELYKKGFLKLPDDVIYIWADNGFGKMVSRRQGNHNPRVYALPEDESEGMHGIYYHASFYDLQAAAQMTMLPNSPDFVIKELRNAYAKKADQYWIINCSNIKPHAYYLELISKIWKDPELCSDSDKYTEAYCNKYYGSGYVKQISDIYKEWPKYSPQYGPNDDDHAGEQFPNHGSRVLTSALITNFSKNAPSNSSSVDEWKWFSDKATLKEQVKDFKRIVVPASEGYREYLSKCEIVLNGLLVETKEIFEDTFVWQVRYLYYSYLGAVHLCNAIEAVVNRNDAPDYIESFYEAGLASEAFKTGYKMMRRTEKGAFKGFFVNDCEADIRQSHYVAKGLMSFVRFLGDGPHFYKWQRKFQKNAGGEKVLLILRTQKHLTDEEMWNIISLKNDSVFVL
ncbi:MAG: glycosyl hydrolase 115 family protein [Lachnospiraceae bacterium]|nr:glycosyl hydrolase 115 family protein [Lachnospiraceae bacterium]